MLTHSEPVKSRHTSRDRHGRGAPRSRCSLAIFKPNHKKETCLFLDLIDNCAHNKQERKDNDNNRE